MASNYPNGFKDGVVIRGLPLQQTHQGQVFWVNNSGVLPKGGVSGSDGNDGSYLRPFSTLDYAIGRCTASRGDIIMLMPGHAESVTAAAGMVFDVAGVAVVGLGSGSLQPQISFTTIATADIDISAANVSFHNIRFTAGVADVTTAIDVAATADNLGFYNCLFDESATDLNYVVVMDLATGCDGLTVDGCTYIGGDASNDTFIQLAGAHLNVTVTNTRMIHTVAQTATAGIITSGGACVNMLLKDNFFHSESAAVAAAFVVLTGTAHSGWAINNYLSHVDTDATAANSVSAFDVTGLVSFNTLIGATGDTYGVQFATAEDLT